MIVILNIKIYYNLECGILCNILVLICNVNIEFEIIEYFVNFLFKNEFIQLIVDVSLMVREVICKNVDFYCDLELDCEDWMDEQFLDFMLQYLILINCLFVVIELGICLSCLLELVLEILLFL